MTAHKHAAMIKAKADNMDLVVFTVAAGKWEIVNEEEGELPYFDSDYPYFLCLPQHKEACLHVLNGGDIEFSYKDYDDWIDSCKNGKELVWSEDLDFMSKNYHFRIKGAHRDALSTN